MSDGIKLCLAKFLAVRIITQDELVQRFGKQTTLHLPGASTGELVPDFSGTSLDDEGVHLSDLRGKTVLVNVFAS